jgi:hypothetical protein
MAVENRGVAAPSGDYWKFGQRWIRQRGARWSIFAQWCLAGCQLASTANLLPAILAALQSQFELISNQLHLNQTD